MNYKWNYQPPTLPEREAARALSREIGISPILCKLLQERGIHTAAEAKRFFRPQLNDLHNPFLMKDMDVAVERLNLAMGRENSGVWRLRRGRNYSRRTGFQVFATVLLEHRLLYPRQI